MAWESILSDLTKPCCEDCWAQKNPGRIPVRLEKDLREEETCIFCKRSTLAGIYVRMWHE